LLMLAFNLKQTDRVGLAAVLSKTPEVEGKQWASAASFIQELDAFRERLRASTFSRCGPEECRDVALQYYTLTTQAAFHFRGTSLSSTKLTFRWHDTFNPQLTVAYADWQWERACTLFNISAALSYLATTQDRGTPDGMKQACQYFQQAAGAIVACRDVCSSSSWIERTPDVTAEFLEALESILLAQAQKCFFEKATADGMKDAIVAKIAAECAALYEDASLKLSAPKLQQSCDKEWLEVVQWNRLIFDGWQHYFAASGHAEKCEYGAQVSRLTHATDQCARAVIACSKADPALQEQFKRAHAMAKEAHRKAKHDNDTVYYEKVPPVATLPKLERKAMVKAVRLPSLDVPEPLPDPPLVSPQPSASSTASAPASAPAALPTDGMAQVTLNESAPPPSFAASEAADVSELVRMGFSEEASRTALQKANGDIQLATEVLLGNGS